MLNNVDSLNNYSASYVIRRLLKENIKPYLKIIGIAVFFMVIVAACSAAIVNLVEPAIDQIFVTKNKDMLVLMPSIMVAIYCLKGIAEYYQSYLIKSVGQMILTDLQMKMYKHLLLSDISFVQSQSSGRLISRFTNDISLMRGAVSNLLVGCAKHFLSVVFLIAIMFKLEPVISSFVFFAFPIAIYPVQKLGRRIRKLSGQAQAELGNYTAKLDETFHSIKIVKSFQGEDIETARASNIASNILNFYKKAAKSDALVGPIMEILSGCAIGSIIWYGGCLVISGKTTPGALFAFITAFVSAYRPFKSLVALNVNLQEGIAAAKRVFGLLDVEPVISDIPNAKSIEFDNPDIQFDNVSLNFKNKTAIIGMNLLLKSHSTTAIVGKSGSGKTSLGNLLVRFYDPSNGKVLINTHDIKTLSIKCLRHNISLVTQDTMLFDTTIAENIAYGYNALNIEKEMQRIVECAKSANAHEFICKLPEGYNTKIGTQGCSLSGGQKQRISIARAFFKDAPILILDEATSALDLNSEQFILNSLMRLRNNKTNIIVTHRLSSITWVENIVVMKDGEIKEQGTHENLMKSKGEYYSLYSREQEFGTD